MKVKDFQIKYNHEHFRRHKSTDFLIMTLEGNMNKNGECERPSPAGTHASQGHTCLQRREGLASGSGQAGRVSVSERIRDVKVDILAAEELHHPCKETVCGSERVEILES